MNQSAKWHKFSHKYKRKLCPVLAEIVYLHSCNHYIEKDKAFSIIAHLLQRITQDRRKHLFTSEEQRTQQKKSPLSHAASSNHN